MLPLDSTEFFVGTFVASPDTVLLPLLPEETFRLCLAEDICLVVIVGTVEGSGSHDFPGPNSNCLTVCSITKAKYLLISTHDKLMIFTQHIYTVGPRLSEHLCATSMLKVFR